MQQNLEIRETDFPAKGVPEKRFLHPMHLPFTFQRRLHSFDVKINILKRNPNSYSAPPPFSVRHPPDFMNVDDKGKETFSSLGLLRYF